MRKIMVKVRNDRERNAVLKSFEMSGCRWKSGASCVGYEPSAKYPYYLFRYDNGRVAYCTDVLPWHKDFKEVPVGNFKKFMEPTAEITIYSDGKKVKAVRSDGKIGVARCSPEDKFDLKTGAKLAIDRLYGINAGDVVEIVSAGAAYNTYAKFFEEKNLPIDIASRFQYGGVPEKGLRGTVLGVYDHSHFCRKIAVVEIAHGTIYLMGVEGLKKV